MAGLSMIEAIVGVAIFALVAVSLYEAYTRVFQALQASRAKIVAMLLANEQFEIARNLAYADVGTTSGIPFGKLIPVQTSERSGLTFIATTTVRNIDLAFDGTAGGSPNDLSPADNKLVEVEIMCTTCKNFRPIKFTTRVGPRGLEGSSSNGSLFVRAIDAVGLPISGADVHIYNPSTVPVVNITDVTGANGMLQIIDAPPATESYEITVSKAGYSTEQTYGPPVVNPVKPHATIIAQTVTQATFAIDQLASLTFRSVNPSCAPIPDVGTRLAGAKLIATSPDILKYDKWFSTGGSGVAVKNDVEWDTYTLEASSTTHDLAGVSVLSPFSVAPGATQEVQIVMLPNNPSAVLVTVRDPLGLPIAGADVTLDPGGAPTTLVTGRGFLRQTDWSGGSGQDAWTDATRYFSDDGNVDTIGTPGEVKLVNTLGVYAASGILESSTFDTGSASNFYQLTFLPVAQPPQTGNSVRLQIATANDPGGPWNYLGPDGTAATFYDATTPDIAAVHNGNRYLRYKLYLSTDDPAFTPNVADIQFTFTSACVPPGQVLFQGLASGNYNLSVTKTGYAPHGSVVSVSAGTPWQETQVTLNP